MKSLNNSLRSLLVSVILLASPVAQAITVFDLTTCQEIEILDRSELQRPRRYQQKLMDDMIIDIPSTCWFGKDEAQELEDEVDEDGEETTVYLSPVDRLIYFGISVNDPYFWIVST